SSGSASYTFQGTKRFTGPTPAKDLSTVYASVSGASGVIATGVLTCKLDQLLRAYEGLLADGPHIVADLSIARQRLHNVINHTVTTIYPHLAPMLVAGRAMPDGLWKTLAFLAEILLPNPLPQNGPSIDDVVGGIEGFLAAASGKQVQTI